MKLALFKNVEYASEIVWQCAENAYIPENYARISAIVDVEFPPLPLEEVVQSQMAALDEAEKKIRAEFQVALNGVMRKKAELLALTYEPEPL